MGTVKPPNDAMTAHIYVSLVVIRPTSYQVQPSTISLILVRVRHSKLESTAKSYVRHTTIPIILGIIRSIAASIAGSVFYED